MHDSPFPNEIPFRTLERPGAALGLSLLLIAVGVVAAVLAAADPARLWTSLHFNWLFWSSVAMGMVILAVALHLTDAEWAWSLRRFALGGVAFLPISYLLLPLILFFGNEYLFHHWLHVEGDPVIDAKRAWLNLPGLTARDLIAVALLYALALAFAYYSLRPDLHNVGDARQKGLYARFTRGWRGEVEEAHQARRSATKVAPVLALAYAVIWGIVAIDLAMSLLPHWFSTMFPVAFFVTGFHGGIAATAIAATVLRRRLGLEDYITARQYHDLGKLLFAFSVFWAYLNWSQYIVIWYGLLPLEQEWFIQRLNPPFSGLVRAVVLLVFLIPFLGLLTRPPKKVPAILAFFAGIILLGHWLERYLLVVPSLYEAPAAQGAAEHAALPLGIPEIGIGLGFLGLFLAAYTWYARSFPLLPSAASLAAMEPAVIQVPVAASATK